MSWKSRTWFIASILLFIAAGYFWRLGEVRRFQAKPPAAASESLKQPGVIPSSNAPISLLLNTNFPALTANSNASVPGTPSGNRFPYRLSNSQASLKELMRSDSAILLRNAFWDTTQTIPEIPGALSATNFPGSAIVQSKGFLNQGFRDLLKSVDAQFISYIPNNACLVRISEAGASQLASHPQVQAVLPYEPYYKLDEWLLPRALHGQALAADDFLVLTLFPGADETGRLELASHGAHIVCESRSPFGPLITVQPDPQNWATLAQLSSVQTVEKYAPRRLANDLARPNMGISVDSVTNGNVFGLTGTNVLVNLNDTGVDDTHPDLKGRVLAMPGRSQDLTDPVGHGTHVAGTIAGDGSKSSTVTNALGSVTNADFRGMAPQAKVFILPVDVVNGRPTIGDTYLQENAARTNALISNNSWNYPGRATYDSSAASYDAAVRDALPEKTGGQPVLFVFAAGNDGFGKDDGTGGEPGGICSPGTAKNIITVGALDQFRNITNEVEVPDGAGNLVTNAAYLATTDSYDQVTSFSSRGNVGIGTEGESGRFKPDVVAPGAFVISARSKQFEFDTNPVKNQVELVRNQEVAPAALNNYYILVPNNATNLQIEIVPQGMQRVDLPIYIKRNNFPTTTDYDIIATNSFTLPSDNLALTPGDWFYSVGNDNGFYVTYDIQTKMTLTNYYGSYFEKLKEFDDSLAPYYRFESGTSMSAPVVSGLLALLKEFYEQKIPADVRHTNSPALMKALLINGARSTSPRYDLQVGKTLNQQGWGMPSLVNCAVAGWTNGTINESPLQMIDQSLTNSLATGESVAWQLKLTEEAQAAPLRVTLVWTDPPGNPNAAIKLVNDLDLVVSNEVTHEVYVGNNIPTGSDYNLVADPTTITNDVVNNVENVFIYSPGSNLVVQVSARRVNVNAVTEHTNKIAQDFALVISCGDLSLTNALTLKYLTNSLTGAEVTTLTNGVPLLGQRVGANSPLLGGSNGTASQWRFYVFTNEMAVNSMSNMTNGSNVAFITFMPPNLASLPRNEEADIDLYVSRNPALTNLDPVVLASADKATNRGGTEVVFYTNAVVGPGEVYYIGVKSEDQRAAEYGFIGLSSNAPFDEDNGDGRLLHGYPIPTVIPDGSPEKPGASLMFAIGTRSFRIGRTVVRTSISHQNLGDLLGNLSHSGQFVVLNNHSLNDDNFTGTNFFIFDDSNQGDIRFSRPTDGPGRLSDFTGGNSMGVWILTMVDNAIGQTGQVNNLQILLDPDAGLQGLVGTVEPKSWDYYFIDVPEEATNLIVRVWDMDPALPLNVYVRRGDYPTAEFYDKMAIFDPNSVTNVRDLSLTVGLYDAPPLIPGRYFIGVYNPNNVSVTYRVDAELKYDLSGGKSQVFLSTDTPMLIKDNATIYSTNMVQVDLNLIDVRVGVRIDHPRLSDLILHLISPQGTRVLLAEARGGTNATAFGTGDTNSTIGYTVFTENTNVASTLIKFAQPPYTNAQAKFQVYKEDFEKITPGVYTNSQVFGGWSVLTNQVEVLDSLNLAQTGKQLLDLQQGWLKRGLPTKPGNSYILESHYRTKTSDPRLVSWWPAEGDGRNLAGTNTASVLTGLGFSPGMSGQAFDFNGTNGHAVVVAAPTLNQPSFTWVAWIKPRQTTNAMPIIEYGGKSGPPGVSLWLGLNFTNGTQSPGSLFANIPDESGNAHQLGGTGLGQLQPDQWAHVALTYNHTNGEAVLYVNGSVNDSAVFAPAFVPYTFATNNVFFGFRLSSVPVLGGTHFNGLLDEVSLFNAPLTSSEVQSIFQAGTAGLCGSAIYSSLCPAQAQIQIPGTATNVVTGTNIWQTNLLSFRASTNATSVEYKALESGLLFDDIILWELSSDSYFLPEESLDVFQGQSGLGAWTLEVADTRAGPTNKLDGRLISWELQLLFATPARTAITLTNGVPYLSTVAGDEIRYFVVDVPRSARWATNLLFSTGDVILVGNRAGLPVGDPLLDDYYVNNMAANAWEYLLLGTNQPLAAPLQPGQRYYLGVKNANPTETNQFLIYVEFDQVDFPITYITQLGNNVPLTRTIAAGTNLDYYWFRVTTNAVSLQFDLWPTNGNVNLLARRYRPSPDPLPSLSAYDFISQNPGLMTDQIVVNTNSSPIPLTPGIWLLGVANTETNPVTYTIRALETNAFLRPIIDLVDGVSLDYRVRTGGINEYFRFRISDTNSAARFSLFNQNGLVDLILRRGAPPSPSVLDAGSFLDGLEPEEILLSTNGTPTVIGSTNRITYLPPIVTNNVFVLRWNSISNQAYLVQGKTNLSDGAWTDMSSPILATNDVTEYLIPLPSPYRYFKAAFSAPITNQIVMPDLNGDWYLAVLNRDSVPVDFTIRAKVTPPVDVLSKEILRTNLFIQPGWHYYEYNVSTNATMAMFELTPANGDLALYVRKDSGSPEPWPGTNQFDYFSDLAGKIPEQIILFTNSTPQPLAPGKWFLGVYNPRTNQVAYTIGAWEYTDSVPMILALNSGETVTNLITGTNGMDYYQFVVSAAAEKVVFGTSSADGNVDLYLQRGLPLPGPGRYHYTSAQTNTNDEQIVVTRASTPVALTAGTWFLSVSNADTQAVSYAVTATEYQTLPVTNIDVRVQLSITNGFVVLNWGSIIGASYRVEGKVQLTDPAWNIVASNLVAVSTNTSYLLSLTNTNHFFRVMAESGAPVEQPKPVFVIPFRSLDSNGFSMQWTAAPNLRFELQFSTNLVDWLTLANPVTSTTGNYSYVDPVTPVPNDRRFYRVIPVP